MLFFGSNNPNHYLKDRRRLMCGGYLFCNNCIISSGFNYANPLPDDINFSLIWTPFFPRLIYSRVLYPSSKVSTFQFSQMLLEPPDFQLHQIYRALGILAQESDLYRPSYIGLARSWETTITVSCIMIVQISFLRLNRKTDFANMALLKSIVPIRL